MNNERRKAIRAAYATLTELSESLGTIKSEFEDLKGTLEGIRDEEEEAYNNMPEGLQQGERGQANEQARENLDTAINALEELDSLPDFSEALEALDNAENG